MCPGFKGNNLLIVYITMMSRRGYVIFIVLDGFSRPYVRITDWLYTSTKKSRDEIYCYKLMASTIFHVTYVYLYGIL